MPLTFQDWSVIPFEILHRKFGVTRPPEGQPHLIKVFSTDEASLEDLFRFAEENKLTVDTFMREKNSKRWGDRVWQTDHIDLYGENLKLADGVEVMSPKEVELRWAEIYQELRKDSLSEVRSSEISKR